MHCLAKLKAEPHPFCFLSLWFLALMEPGCFIVPRISIFAAIPSITEDMLPRIHSSGDYSGIGQGFVQKWTILLRLPVHKHGDLTQRGAVLLATGQGTAIFFLLGLLTSEHGLEP
jgi:hypothetical protein